MIHGGRGRTRIPASERAPQRRALAPPMKLSVSFAGNNARDNNNDFKLGVSNETS